jgi:predicted metal-dependent peptidase
MLNFQDQIFSLLQQEPFFAAFSRCINKREALSGLVTVETSLPPEEIKARLESIGPVEVKESVGLYQKRADAERALSLSTPGFIVTPSPTLGVRIDKWGYFELQYNPAYVASLSENERSGALMHEYYHCILGHLTTRCPFPFSEIKQNQILRVIWNYATDLAINSLLPETHVNKKWLLPGRNYLDQLSEKEKKEVPDHKRAICEKIKSFPPGKESEWYYQRLLENKKDFEASATYSMQWDEHGEWGEGDANDEAREAAKEMAKAVLRDAMEKGAKESTQRSWGSVPEEMRKNILEQIRGVIDWRKVLAWFCNASVKSDWYNSIRKINKRYPYIHAGKRATRTANIAVSIDQSGSVSDSLLASFYAELDSLSSYVTFTVVPFDSEVSEKDIFVWKKGERKTWERFLSGGTDFSSPTKWVNEARKFDGHIILTDMCAERPIPSRVPRLWITDEANAQHPVFEPSPERMVVIRGKGEV